MVGKPRQPATKPVDELAEREAQLRVEKLVLEQEKLKLETQTLGRVASRQGLWLEWLKAASVPIAVLSVFVSGTIGFTQLNQASHARADDRLEKAAERSQANTPNERQTGIIGLRLILSERPAGLQRIWPDRRSVQRRAAALHYMMIALASETNTRVQADILAGVGALKKQDVGQEALDLGLRTAIEQNRSLASEARAATRRQWKEEKEEDRRQQLVRAQRLERAPQPTEASLQPEADEDAELLKFNADPYDLRADRIPLNGLAKAIVLLTGQGGRSSDYSGIYSKGATSRS